MNTRSSSERCILLFPNQHTDAMDTLLSIYICTYLLRQEKSQVGGESDRNDETIVRVPQLNPNYQCPSGIRASEISTSAETVRYTGRKLEVGELPHRVGGFYEQRRLRDAEGH
ncbi:hypothetical protein KM043_010794 [Ampulex compressa]|nr:hypothetical protein KM043_010794 [Ampulex compressa]